MGINLEITSDTIGAGSRAWLADDKGFDTCRSVTLLFELFEAEHSPEGFIPSGTVIGRVTASGLYGPYDDTALDGREVARGHLFDAVRITRGDGNALTRAGAAMLWEGIVLLSKLPTFEAPADVIGVADAAAQADLGNFIRYEA